MSVEEIFSSEKRNEDNLFEIYFYLEGSFWRAYEWSAFLSRNFPSELNEDERLKPIRKVTKNCKEGFVQVGLQLTSFDKYFPEIRSNSELFEVNDKQIVIHCTNFFKDIEFNDYEKLLNEWKSSIKLSDNEKKKNKEINSEKQTKEINTDDLIKEIISYPIENRTLIENLQFLSYIKDSFRKILK